jgi:Cytochrome C oxidase, cbb3-type, subunit III
LAGDVPRVALSSFRDLEAVTGLCPVTLPENELVVDRVTHGQGVMPAFGDDLSEQQIQDVAAFVVDATSG